MQNKIKIIIGVLLATVLIIGSLTTVYLLNNTSTDVRSKAENLESKCAFTTVEPPEGCSYQVNEEYCSRSIICPKKECVYTAIAPKEGCIFEYNETSSCERKVVCKNATSTTPKNTACPTKPPCDGGSLIIGDPLPGQGSCAQYVCVRPTTSPSADDQRFDFNKDGKINSVDLSMFLSAMSRNINK